MRLWPGPFATASYGFWIALQMRGMPEVKKLFAGECYLRWRQQWWPASTSNTTSRVYVPGGSHHGTGPLICLLHRSIHPHPKHGRQLPESVVVCSSQRRSECESCWSIYLFVLMPAVSSSVPSLAIPCCKHYSQMVVNKVQEGCAQFCCTSYVCR